MGKIDPDRLARYRELGKKSMWDLKNTAAKEIFQRMEAEGCSLDDYMFNPHKGMFHAPFSRDLKDVDIAFVGSRMENTVPERAGTRYGPDAVRKWSHTMGPIHHVTGVVPFDMCNIIDYGDVDFDKGFDVKERVDAIYDVFKALTDHNVSTLCIGGEHTMTYPILKAHGSKEPLGLIHIDAHADTAGNIGGGEINDANAMRNAVMDGVIDPEKTIQLGIRGRCYHWWDFSFETGMRVVDVEEFQEKGPLEMVREAREIIGDGPCYLTLDIDVLDPVHLPGTGLPEPFGLTSRELRDFIRGLRGLDIVGADIAEICPPADPSGISANIGAGMCFEMLCLLCEAHTTRTGRRNKTRWK